MGMGSVGMPSLSGWRGRWYVGCLVLSLVRVVRALLPLATATRKAVQRGRRCIRVMRHRYILAVRRRCIRVMMHRRCIQGITGSEGLGSGSLVRLPRRQLLSSRSLRMSRHRMWVGRSRRLNRSSKPGAKKARRGRSPKWKGGRAHPGRQHRQGWVLLLQGARPSRSRGPKARVLVRRLFKLLFQNMNQKKGERRRRGDFH